MRKTTSELMGGATCQGTRQPEEAGKDKKTSSPLECAERNTYQHLDFSEIDLVRPILNS